MDGSELSINRLPKKKEDIFLLVTLGKELYICLNIYKIKNEKYICE